MLPREEDAALEIFDVLGRKVRAWEWARLSAGPHVVAWSGVGDNGRAVSPGLFICKLRAGIQGRTQKIVVWR